MTTRLLLVILARRWAVALVGLVLTMGALVHVEQSHGLYWSQVDVVFLAPASARTPNRIEETTGSVIALAGVVATELE